MSWLNLNQSLNSLKGQITNFASEVLSEAPEEDTEEKTAINCQALDELREKCNNQELEIIALKKLNDELQTSLQNERISRKNGVKEEESSWYWDPPSQPTGSNRVEKQLDYTYKTQIQSLQNEISNLRERANNDGRQYTEEELQRLREENKHLTTSLEDLDNQHQLSMEKLLGLKTELQKNFEVLKQEHDDMKSTNDRYIAEIKDLQAKLEAKEKEELEGTSKFDSDTLNHKYQNLERVHSLLKENAEKFQEENQELHEEVFKLQEQVTKLEHEIEMSTKHPEYSNVVPRDHYENLLQELTDLRGSNMNTSQINLDVSNMDDNAKSFIENLNKEIHELKHKLAQKNLEDHTNQPDSKLVKSDKILQLYDQYINFELPVDYVWNIPSSGEDTVLFKLESAFRTLHEFKKDIDSLEHALTEKGHNEKRLQSQIKDLTVENDLLTTDVHNYYSELSEMKKNNDFLLTEITALKNTSKLQPIIETHEDNLVKLESELADSTRMNVSFQSQLKRIEQELSDVRSEKTSLEKSLKDLKEKYNSIFQEVEVYKVQSKKVEELQDNVHSEQVEKLQKAMEENDSMKKKLHAANTKNEQLSLDVHIIENDKVLLTKKVDDLNHELNQRSALCNEMLSIKSSMENKLKDLESKITEVYYLKTELENEKATLLNKVQILEQERNNLEGIESKLQGDSNIQALELKKILSEKLLLQDKFDSTVKENNLLQSKILFLTKELEGLNKGISELKNSSTLELKKLTSENLLVSEKLESTIKNNNLLQTKIIDLSKELEALKHHEKELLQQVSTLRDTSIQELKKLTSENLLISDTLETTVREDNLLQKQIIDLTNELETLKHHENELLNEISTLKNNNAQELKKITSENLIIADKLESTVKEDNLLHLKIVDLSKELEQLRHHKNELLNNISTLKNNSIQEINKLTSENLMLSDKLDSTVKEDNMLQSRIVELNKELEDIKQRKKDLLKEMSILQNNCTQELNKLTSENLMMSDKLESTVKEDNLLQSKIKDLTIELDGLKHRENELLNEISILNNNSTLELKKLSAENLIMADKLESTVKEDNFVKSKLKDLTKEFEELKRYEKELLTEISTLKNNSKQELKKLTSENLMMADKLENTVKEDSLLQSQIKNFTKELDELKHREKVLLNEISTLKNNSNFEVKKFTSEKDILSDKLESTVKDDNLLHSKIKDLNIELDDLKNREKELLNEISTLKNNSLELKKLTSENLMMANKLDTTVKEDKLLQSKIKDLTKELDGLKHREKELLVEISTLKNNSILELKKLASEKLMMANKLESTVKEDYMLHTKIKILTKELEELKDREKELITEISTLKDNSKQELKKLTSENLKMADKLKNFVKKDNMLHSKIEDLTKEIEEFKRREKELLNEISTLKNNSNEELKKVTSENLMMADKLENTVKEKIMLQSKTSKLTKELEILRHQEQKLINEISVLKNSTGQELKKLTSEKLVMSDKLESTVEKDNLLRSKINNLTKELEGLRHHEKELLGEITTLRNSNTINAQEMTLLHQTIADFKSKIPQQEFLKTEITNLKSENEELLRLKRDLEVNLTIASEKIQKLENDCFTLNSEVKKKVSEIEALNIIITESNSTHVHLQQVVKDLQNNITFKENEIDNLNKSLLEITHKLNEEYNKWNKTNEEFQTLTHNKDLLNKQITELNDQLNIKETEILEYKSKYNASEAKCQKCIALVDSKDKEIKELSQSLVELNEKIRNIDNATHENNDEINKIIKEKESIEKQLTGNLTLIDQELIESKLKYEQLEKTCLEYKALIDNATAEKGEIINLVTLKHNESIQYHNEIQRLNHVLLEQSSEFKKLVEEKERLLQNNAELAKNCSNCDKLAKELQEHNEIIAVLKTNDYERNNTLREKDEIITALNKSDYERNKTDLMHANETIVYLTEKCENLDKNLTIQLEAVKELTAETLQLSEREQNSSRELERLRHHLMETEENYTQELMASEQKLTECQTRLHQIEERAKQNNTVYTSNSIRANQEVETLRNQIRLLEKQRDDVQGRLSAAEDANNRSEAALTNLQVVLEQFQQDKERDIQSATEKLRNKIVDLKRQNNDLNKEIERLTLKLNESVAGLRAATRLGDQLETKTAQINDLKEQVRTLQSSVQGAEEKYNNAITNQQDKVDKNLVKNVVLNYVTSANQSTSNRSQVLRVLSTVLDFNQSECEKLGLGRPQANLTTDSLAREFVRFLEKESRPAAPLPAMSGLGHSGGSRGSTPTNTNTTIGAPTESTHRRNTSTGSNNLLFQNITNSETSSHISIETSSQDPGPRSPQDPGPRSTQDPGPRSTQDPGPRSPQDPKASIGSPVFENSGVNQTRNTEGAILKQILKDM